MTYYKISFVAQVDDQGRPLIADTGDGKSTTRNLSIWDERSIDDIRAAYDADHSLKVERLGQRHAPGRPLEHRGPIIIFKPHLISVERDFRATFAQPGGPLPFEPREK